MRNEKVLVHSTKSWENEQNIAIIGYIGKSFDISLCLHFLLSHWTQTITTADTLSYIKIKFFELWGGSWKIFPAFFTNTVSNLCVKKCFTVPIQNCFPNFFNVSCQDFSNLIRSQKKWGNVSDLNKLSIKSKHKQANHCKESVLPLALLTKLGKNYWSSVRNFIKNVYKRQKIFMGALWCSRKYS